MYIAKTVIVRSYKKNSNYFSGHTSSSITENQNTSRGLSYRTQEQKNVIIKDHISFTTYNLQMSLVENEIADLESMECTAILKRDTSTLKRLWTRDFTLDDLLNEMLVNGKNPLPYYTSYNRMVENFNSMGDIAFTSGYEFIQPLKANGKMENPVKRNYFHTWIRKNGIWQLSTKTHN
jgi:hypothetical protein